MNIDKIKNLVDVDVIKQNDIILQNGRTGEYLLARAKNEMVEYDSYEGLKVFARFNEDDNIFLYDNDEILSWDDVLWSDTLSSFIETRMVLKDLDKRN